ncbi:Rha family transcriptional regulator [Paenibacillus lycopersici]|uniref:Rha family transcriptional regulator n=1 Tax=Paenibacillus lycopersici TaxID=2704462 RepID=A0A6C0G235_9BACL|nr:Rha family transcriptional regulator [Paenibacillus lycopersici]QHT61731.1 Rha family transcriptional regulator [Paenibacillus lycopersici]
MTQLVFIDNGKPVTDSLAVAETFSKRHDDVLKAIRNLECSDDFRLRNFAETPYTHPQNGQTYSKYLITQDGFSFLVMGFTGKEAARFKEMYIGEFNRMRDQLSVPMPKVPLANMEHDKITKLLQMVRMAEQGDLFTPETDRAIRKQIAEMITGQPRVETAPQPARLPRPAGNWYTTKEVAAIAKVTVHLISKLSSEHGLRTEQFCRLESNRSGENSTGLTWVVYNETAKDLLVEYANERIALGYTPRLGQKWSRKRARG